VVVHRRLTCSQILAPLKFGVLRVLGTGVVGMGIGDSFFPAEFKKAEEGRATRI